MKNVYYLNSHYENQKKAGIPIEVKTVSDLEYFPDGNLVELYQLCMELAPETVFEVGCKLGQNLKNIHNLVGCHCAGSEEEATLYNKYGQKHFDFGEDIIYYYHDRSGELVFCANYDPKDEEVLISRMLQISKKYVVLVGASEATKEKYADYNNVVIDPEVYPNLLVLEVVADFEEEEEDAESEE